MGFFIPTHGQVEGDIVALKKAGKALDKMLEAQHVDIEDVVVEFKMARKKVTPSKKIKAK